MNANLRNDRNMIMTVTMIASTNVNINMSRNMTVNAKMIEQVN